MSWESQALHLSMPSPDGSPGKQGKKQKIKAASKSNTERHRGILSTENSCLAENCRMFFKAALKKLTLKA